MNLAIILPLLGIVVAPLLGYFAATRKLSGKIQTSEAADLWTESRSIRDDYKAENVRLRDRLDDAEEQITRIQADSDTLRRANRTLEQTCERLTAANADCQAETKLLHDRIAVLESAASLTVVQKEEAVKVIGEQKKEAEKLADAQKDEALDAAESVAVEQKEEAVKVIDKQREEARLLAEQQESATKDLLREQEKKSRRQRGRDA